MSSLARIGLLGTGSLGTPIARRLLNAGFQLSVWNRTSEKCLPLEDAGATYLSTPAEVVANSDVTLSVLSDNDAVVSVYYHPNGVLHNSLENKLLVDCSTVDFRVPIAIGAEIMKKGGNFLEAPVCGSKSSAEDGNLLMLVGGDEEKYNEMKPVWEAISKKSYYFGEYGAASKMSASVNMLKGCMMLSFAEGLSLVGRMNLKPQDFVDIVRDSSVSSPLFEETSSAMLSREYEPQLALKHMHKDLRLALGAARMHPPIAPLTMGNIAEKLYDMAVQEKGGGDKMPAAEGGPEGPDGPLADMDFSAVFELVRDLQENPPGEGEEAGGGG